MNAIKKKRKEKSASRARKHSLINAICQIINPPSSISNVSNERATAIKRNRPTVFLRLELSSNDSREKRKKKKKKDEKWKRYQTFGNERVIIYSHSFHDRPRVCREKEREREVCTPETGHLSTVSSFRVTSVDGSFAFLANVLPAEQSN